MNSKKSKCVFITGASRGIGAGIARRLAADGLSVAVGYNSNKDTADEIVNEILSASGVAISIPLNVESRDSIKKAVALLQRKFGIVDVLVNNAAIAQEKPFLEITDNDWDHMLGVNLRGPFALIQEVLPQMLDQGYGRIVNISSIGGQWGGINQIHYASAKAGLIGLTRSIAKTFSSNGVTCNAVAPGLVATEMSAAELNTEAGKEKVKNIPCGRLGLVEEVAGAVSYLVGPDGGYVTGQTLNLNGGMYFG